MYQIGNDVTTIFQFTTSQGGRLGTLGRSCGDRRLSIHDLTRRSTPSGALQSDGSEPFNSRPHKEVDNTR